MDALSSKIKALRKEKKKTQQNLADLLNIRRSTYGEYERGKILPPMDKLKIIADYFGVTVDYLLTEEHKEDNTSRALVRQRRKNRIVISAISVLLVWVVATFAFAMISVAGSLIPGYLMYIYALPLSFVLLLVFNCVWGRRKYNYFIVSLLMWTSVLSVYLTVLSFGLNLWIMFIAAAPMQLIFMFVPGISLIRYGRVRKEGE